MSKRNLTTGGRVLWIVVASVAFAVVLLMILHKIGGKGPDEVSDAQVSEGRILDVRVLNVTPAAARDMIDVPGYLEPFADATIAAEKPGRIVEITVEKGDRVTAGQVLLRLNDRLWKAHEAQAEVQAREAAKEWARWNALQDSGAVSDSEMDAVTKARDLSSAALEEARTLVQQCVVSSPMDGVVADRFVEVGEYSMEGGALLRLVDVDQLKLVLDVPERDVTAVQVGRQVDFTIGGGDRMFRGTVKFVAPAAAAASHSYRTEIQVDNSDGALRAGMIASASLVRRVVKDAIIIPLSAVVNQKGEHVVFVVEDQHAVRRVVHIDSIEGQNVVLQDGLRAGEQLVIAGQRSLQDGRQVKVVDL